MKQLYTENDKCSGRIFMKVTPKNTNRLPSSESAPVLIQIKSTLRVLFIAVFVFLSNWYVKADGVVYNGSSSATLSGTVYDLWEEYDPDFGCNVKHGYWEVNIPSGTVVNVSTVLEQSGYLTIKDQSNYYFYGTGSGTFKPVGNKVYVYFDISEWDENYYYLTTDFPIFYLTAEFQPLTTNDNLYLKNGNLYCDGVLKQINNYGYVQIGAQNTAGAHIYTDMPKFYFNKPIQAITGEFSAYSTTNLSLQTNGITRMTVLQSTGNVGIGTINPIAKLDIGTCLTSGQKGSVFGHLSEGNTTGDGTFLGVVGYGTSPTYSKSFSIEHHFYGQINSSINFFRGGSTTGGFITFNTSENTERMRINTEGNIGVGTNSPGAKLELVSGVNAYPATLNSTQTGGALRLRGGDNAVMDFGMYSTNTWIQATDQSNLGMNYSLSLNPNGGNVGIGRNGTPAEKLTIYGGHSDTRIRLSSTGNGSDIPANLSLWASEPNWTYYGTGIGYNVNGCPNNGRIDQARGSSYIRFLPGEINMNFQNTSSEDISVISIKENGNVSIGTADVDPTGAKLTVKGKIHAQEVLVDLNAPLADYVFSSTYKLRPLHEVEQFVKANSHLPEIPSATEVKDKGLNMGEMQNKLLQKVEELTLYVIEQQKKLEAQSAEIKQLRGELRK